MKKEPLNKKKITTEESILLTYLKKLNYWKLLLWIVLAWIALFAFKYFNNELLYYRLNWKEIIFHWNTNYYNKVEFIRLCVYFLWWYFIYKITNIFYERKKECTKVFAYLLSLVIFYVITTFVTPNYDWLINFMSPWHIFELFFFTLIDLMNLL
jgi:hypothetical protein